MKQFRLEHVGGKGAYGKILQRRNSGSHGGRCEASVCGLRRQREYLESALMFQVVTVVNLRAGNTPAVVVKSLGGRGFNRRKPYPAKSKNASIVARLNEENQLGLSIARGYLESVLEASHGQQG